MLSRLYATGKLSQILLFIACLAGVIGLFASRALISLSPALGGIAIFTNPHIAQALRAYRYNKSAWGLMAVYGLLVLSYGITENVGEWREQLIRQLPWVALPLVIGLSVPLSSKQRQWVGQAYVYVAGAVALATSIKYFLNPAYVHRLVVDNQNMPSALGVFHIHFGIMLALATCFGTVLIAKVELGKFAKWTIIVAIANCILTLHLLAYRTGLLALYATVLVAAGTLLLRRPKVAVALLLLIIVVPVVSYYSMESIRRRAVATVDDVQHFTRHRNINNYSIARRMAAWVNAGTLIQENPILGVGPADTFDAMMAQYDRRSFGLRYKNRVMLHNQYLHMLVGSGIIGLALWLWVLFRPLFKQHLRADPAIVSFIIVQATAMLVDSLLEMQLGLNIFLFPYVFLIVGRERATRATELEDMNAPPQLVPSAQ